MLVKLLVAILVGVMTALGCFLIGALLVVIPSAISVTLGHFLEGVSGLVGLLAALAYLVRGYVPHV